MVEPSKQMDALYAGCNKNSKHCGSGTTDTACGGGANRRGRRGEGAEGKGFSYLMYWQLGLDPLCLQSLCLAESQLRVSAAGPIQPENATTHQAVYHMWCYRGLGMWS